MPWYTMTDEFDTDFGVDESHGTNAFIRDGHSVFRTYFINNRGDEAMGSTWSYLDLTALGGRRSGKTRPRATPRPCDLLPTRPRPRFHVNDGSKL